jgi:hypothetical protein
MKKLLLIIILLFSLSSKGQTSVYHPFPDSNGIWNMDFYLWAGCWPVSDLYQSYSYVLSGDTIINAVTYHKLNIPFVQTTCSGFHTAGYQGCIRQDTSIKKVFFISPNETTEELLYDFNLQVGDTVHGVIQSWTGQLDTVVSIDSVLIGSDYRKRWLINPPYNVYIIEGIGSTYGVIEPSPGYVTDLPGIAITCFKQDGQTLFPDASTSCNVILSVENIPGDNFSVSFSPNPFHASATLSIHGNSVIKGAELNFFNSVGETIFTQNITGQSWVIERKNLPSGIYFYRLLNESKTEIIATGKFVIE